MDIRNFFGGGGGGSAKKKANGNASSKKKAAASKDRDTDKTKPKPKPTSKTVKKDPSEDKKVEVTKFPEKPRTKTAVKKDEDIKPKRRKIQIELSDSDSDFEPKVVAKKVKAETPKSKAISSSTSVSNSHAKRRVRVIKSETIDIQSDDDSSPNETPTPTPKKVKAKVTASKSPPKRRKATPKAKTPPKPKMLKPTESIASYPDPSPGIFEGMTFVFTGIMDDLNREDGIDYVKELGGRVTTAVSGKTDYLVIGSVLENGKEVEDGSKFKKATELGKVHILKGAGELYGLAKLYDHKKKELGVTAGGGDADGESPAANKNPYKKSTPIANPYAKSTGSAIKNPYAKTTKVVNPYAKKVVNPYAKSTSASSTSNPYAKKSSAANGNGNAIKVDPERPILGVNALWADKFAPYNTRMILGNKDSVSKLATWLARWEDNFNRPVKGKKNSFNPKGGPFRAALISGPPGIGKTTTATLVAAEQGRQTLELNASDARSKKTIEASLGDVIGSRVLSFGDSGDGSNKHEKKRVIIMDEVDGMGAGDRGGMAELIKMIKISKVPIICICNDRQSQKVRSLAGHCLDLKYRRPTKLVIAKRAVEVGREEGMTVELNAAEALAESCGNDVRQVLNCLQMWGNKRHDTTPNGADMTYKAFKNRNSLIKKDEMLRVSLFDAAKMICEGRRGINNADEKAQVDSLFKRTDAFFTEYSLMGLLVHQNYLKVGIRSFQQTKIDGDPEAEYKSLEEMCKGTEAMSDFAVAEHAVRSGDQNWGLLPFCSVLAVKSGFHIGGDSGGMLPGFPEFSSWLGKNSSRTKRDRLLQELGHHMNYKISADKTELRLGYLPVMRDRLLSLLMTNDAEGENVKEAIEFMDEYGLDRDDIFEGIDEFTIASKGKKFADLESKSKAAFTREYNKGVHKSQALIEEQGLPTKKRKKKTVDEDDEGQQSEDEVDDEMTAEQVKKMFSKGKKKPAASKAKKSKKKK